MSVQTHTHQHTHTHHTHTTHTHHTTPHTLHYTTHTHTHTHTHTPRQASFHRLWKMSLRECEKMKRGTGRVNTQPWWFSARDLQKPSVLSPPNPTPSAPTRFSHFYKHAVKEKEGGGRRQQQKEERERERKKRGDPADREWVAVWRYSLGGQDNNLWHHLTIFFFDFFFYCLSFFSFVFFFSLSILAMKRNAAGNRSWESGSALCGVLKSCTWWVLEPLSSATFLPLCVCSGTSLRFC